MSRVRLPVALLAYVLACPALMAQDHIHHDFEIYIDPQRSIVDVVDTITLSKPQVAGQLFEFNLHANLKVDMSGGQLRHKALNDAQRRLAEHNDVPLKHYVADIKKQQKKFTVRYQGVINHVLKRPGKEYARSFSETPGLIDKTGIFLAKSTHWYPQADDELVTFVMTITTPAAWTALSQGKRMDLVNLEDKTTIIWEETNPQDDIYIVGGPLIEYSQAAGSAVAMVYLRQPDEALAQKYLDTTVQYIAMYSKLLGPYPYTKFALVENFWETGYGMPSFTLLGPKVIRFPFILHSSFPHEILHNWWGNGVYVDKDKGNWAEGLTAYLADHLIKEQRGKGAEHRRSVLQKYTDFVDEARDFPLTEFKSRHSSSTEAVGYGKTLMLFHMLRLSLGEQSFVQALRRFFHKHKFTIASFADLERFFLKMSDDQIIGEFAQWVHRTGAPLLAIIDTKSQSQAGRYRLSIDLAQQQKEAAYALNVPVAVTIQGQSDAFQTTLRMEQKQQRFEVNLPGVPLKLEVDPEFDVFRRLDGREIPPALSQGFGATKVLVVLPAAADPATLMAYREMAETWRRNQEGDWAIKLDNEITSIPSDRAVWLLGWKNHFGDIIQKQSKKVGVDMSAATIKINGRSFQRPSYSVLLTVRNPNNLKQTVLWVGVHTIGALPGLTRKLPHYRKYSYLAFKGIEPTNIAKGQWAVTESPLSVVIGQAKTKRSKASVNLKPRSALAQLPPVLSEARMVEHIQHLASEQMQGRGLGSQQLNDAAHYIAGQFKAAGLIPWNKATGGYFQTWTQRTGPKKRKHRLKNVIGILPGSNKKLSAESIIVAAHYDHLGKGWPAVYKGNEGKIHYGADDNASGVAVMLELARIVGDKWKPERSILFIAFTGGETELLGSRHYINNNNKQYPLRGVRAMINLDTVGRLGDLPITVFGTGSAAEWGHILRGTGFVTGIKINSLANDIGSSDQKSFLDRGIPAVQFFAAAHNDFHRPGDTADKIDSAGLIKVAIVLKEAVEYLANREEALTITLNTNKKSNDRKLRMKRKGRRVTVGTVPDFAYQGEGVRIASVVSGSSADTAGVTAGDILINIGSEDIQDLAEFAKILKTLKPGDNVVITFLRNGEKYSVPVIVKAR